VPNPNQCLSDFIAPRASGVADYIGLFAVTGGVGLENREAVFQARHDDYGAIMLKAIADRVAEAFAELMHERVRKDLWGYAADEVLTNEQLINEGYRGIRPAPGYPACPEHSVKRAMFEALGAVEIGMTLTESYAMMPASSVSGFYLAHPQSKYFSVGRIGRDQLEDLARRKSQAVSELERWLAPNLG
jgi:5-methyltetrahydrofolate--homocysteine methyltransferase